LNYSAIFSLAAALAITIWAALTSTDNWKTFLDLHGAVIVFGGTVAATAISFELKRTFLMAKVFWGRTVKSKAVDFNKLILVLMKIADSHRNENSDLKNLVEASSDEFLKEGMGLLLDEVVEVEQLTSLLKKRNSTMFELYTADAVKFKAMGKYPPAMGLMGAVLGMIALLSGLGQPGAEKTIGPSMSIALVATLYGIALANLLIIPVGENLTAAAKEVQRKNNIIIEAIRLIAAKTNPIVLAEELNSFLLPKERIDWKKITSL
jgi:chemotaxis protein MotA